MYQTNVLYFLLVHSSSSNALEIETTHYVYQLCNIIVISHVIKTFDFSDALVAEVATLSDEVVQLLQRELLATGRKCLCQGCMRACQTMELFPPGCPNARMCTTRLMQAIVDSEKILDCLAHSNHSSMGQLFLESSS